jgi:SAM-dependent methyltransferase
MQATDMQTLRAEELYTLDNRTRDLLIEAAPLMWQWSRTKCSHKEVGGMEEWAKNHKPEERAAECCDWYHGTWQLLRLLNMVAVPPWYPFYNQTLSSILRAKPNASVFISACADFGMLMTLHEAIKTAGTSPRITIYDICETPLQSCQWYAKRHGLQIETVVDNIITSPRLPLGSFDLIVTDEFLTVLKDDYKPQILKRWRELLRPGGSLVTTAMLGGPTTPELRKGYADRARRKVQANDANLRNVGATADELIARFDLFAAVHTRHMLTDERQIRGLFSEFDVKFMECVPTPGECVNPTNSFQIVATRPAK